MSRQGGEEAMGTDGRRSSPRDRLVCYGELVDACVRMIVRQRVVRAKENSEVMGACKLIASVYGIERLDVARDVVAVARCMGDGEAGETSPGCGRGHA